MKQVKYGLLVFYGFAFMISWTFWLLMSRVVVGGSPFNPLTILLSTLGAAGPLLALLILDRIGGTHHLKTIFSTLRIRSAGKGLLALCVLALPLLRIAGNAIHALKPNASFQIIKDGPADLGWAVIPVMLIHFATAFFTSPLLEEPGWRGFALPRLQSRFGTLAGSAVVGVLWWLWHQPMNIAFGIEPSLYGFLSMLSVSFVIDSLYNRSGRNLLTAMLVHQSGGTVIMFFYQPDHNLIALLPLMLFAIALNVLSYQNTPVPESIER
ncbi:MAG: type II CAAX endopeptidase family protein [candidate division KSB1 bacterium]|nr:type II CAAX endopeptidase family protein [candidate division KSB1 bacterium]